MTTANYKFLKIVEFKNWQNWDPRKYRVTDNSNSGQVLFNKILKKRHIEWVKIEDIKQYQILGVRSYGKGSYTNRSSLGKDLKMRKYQVAKTDDLFWCKVDTKNGAFGIITKEFEGQYASTNMNLISINTDLISIDYLQMLFKLHDFQKYLDSFITGTTNRKYISMDRLLAEVYLPLPATLIEQESLVNNYKNKITFAESKKQQIKELESKIEKYLMDELGIEIVEKKKQDNGYKFLQFVESKSLTRWDWWNTLSSWNSKKFIMSNFEDILSDKPKYGSNSRAKKTISDIRYVRITDINEDGTLNDEFVSSEKPDNQYLLKEKDFLIARSGNTVGKTFLYDKSYGKCMYAGYLVKYTLNEIKVNPQFVLNYTKSLVFKKWIESKQRKSGQPNINGQEYLKFPIPLPPIEIQNKIVAQIELWKKEIKKLKVESEELEASAKREFEEAIFSKKENILI